MLHTILTPLQYARWCACEGTHPDDVADLLSDPEYSLPPETAARLAWTGWEDFGLHHAILESDVECLAMLEEYGLDQTLFEREPLAAADRKRSEAVGLARLVHERLGLPTDEVFRVIYAAFLLDADEAWELVWHACSRGNRRNGFNG